MLDVVMSPRFEVRRLCLKWVCQQVILGQRGPEAGVGTLVSDEDVDAWGWKLDASSRFGSLFSAVKGGGHVMLVEWNRVKEDPTEYGVSLLSLRAELLKLSVTIESRDAYESVIKELGEEHEEALNTGEWSGGSTSSDTVPSGIE